MAITAQQLADIRADIGDEDGTIWTDAEISRVWERVSGAANTLQRHEAALGLLVRQLLGNSAMLHNYRAGATSESLQQVYQNLERLYAVYKPSVESALGSNRQAARRWVKGAPRQDREYPHDYYEDDRRTRRNQSD